MGKSQTRKKKGGKLENEMKLTDGVQQKSQRTELEDSVEDNLKNDFSKSQKGGEDLDLELNENENENKKQKQGNENIELNIQENDNNNNNNNNDKQQQGGMQENNDLTSSAKKAVKSGFDMFSGAIGELTGNKNKIGGATPLQGKLFSVIRNRSMKLKSELENLHSEQNNVRQRTDNALNEVEGLINQFAQYQKMGGGAKRRKTKKRKGKRRKGKRRKSRRT